MDAWHKSSFSAGKQSCVEVAEGPRTRIRDTQYRDLGHLEVDVGEWRAFLTAVRSNQL